MTGTQDHKIASVVKITQAATLYTSGVFPLGTHQSLPIPVTMPQGFCLAFFYCRAEVVEPKQGLKLWPPSHVAYVRADTCKLDRIISIQPSTFERSDPLDKPLGSYLSPPEQNMDDFLTLRAQLAQAYDVTLASYWGAGDQNRSQAEVALELEGFRKLFSQVAEQCLLPYYAALGKTFFAWLDGRTLTNSALHSSTQSAP